MKSVFNVSPPAFTKNEIAEVARKYYTIKGDIDLSWLELDKAKMTGIFLNVPERDQMNLTVNEQLVVELYSK